MDNKATIIMASALVAILLTSTVANQVFARPGWLAGISGSNGANHFGNSADGGDANGGYGGNANGGNAGIGCFTNCGNP